MGKTIDIIKNSREISESLKVKMKEDNKIKRSILKTLEEEDKTIPQIAQEIGLPSDVVTYYLMTLQKFGKIEAGDVDDMDEYFYYKLKK